MVNPEQPTYGDLLSALFAFFVVGVAFLFIFVSVAMIWYGSLSDGIVTLVGAFILALWANSLVARRFGTE